MRQLLQTENEEVCSNVKQQLVRVQNKALCTMMELLLTQHCFITITYLNSFSKQTKKRNLISNSLLKSSIGIYYAKNFRKGDSITAFLVEHNDYACTR
jgi:hypothetical protein